MSESAMRDSMNAVRPSMKALLEGLIDYAGLFPPAALDMANTVRNYASYAGEADAWMLNRLIVPVARLDEFEQHASALLPRDDRQGPWTISALTAIAGQPKELIVDLDRIAAFNEFHCDAGRGLCSIDTIELKAATASEIEAALDVIPDDLFPFFEIASVGDPRGLIAGLVGSDAGAKIRTAPPVSAAARSAGTASPESCVDVAGVARFIAACARAGVPFKATAGMHHPLRHHNASTGTVEHGFLNVFIAAAMADRLELEPEELTAILSAQSLESFEIGHEHIGFAGHVLELEAIERARDLFAVSFGSCSFDEPREGLRSLGIL